MNPEDSKEYKILVTMRQVLASVVREITPEPGMRHPLTEQTMEDVRQCFALIAAREKELADNAGAPSQHRPRFVDETPKAKVVKLHGINDRDKDK
jgi:hypothetical protein